MSLADEGPPRVREAGYSPMHSDETRAAEERKSFIRAPDSESAHDDTPTGDSCDSSIYNQLCNMEDGRGNGTLSPGQLLPDLDVPAVPQKSALRASRLLDNMGMMLGTPREADTPKQGSITPHDLYLSSEEDASSSADDFSDYGFDSSDESGGSPNGWSSHEDMARVVNVVFAGKPLLIHLRVGRPRSTSPNSTVLSRRDSAASTTSRGDRPSTPASSVSSLHQPSKKSSLFMGKERLSFLNTDPFAKTRASVIRETQLDVPAEETPTKVPKTPTQIFMGGVSKTFSLVRKKSKPILSPPFTHLDGYSTGLAPYDRPRSTDPIHVMDDEQDLLPPPKRAATDLTPMTPMRFDNASAWQDSSAAETPRRGIFGGLATRRRSIKLPGRLI